MGTARLALTTTVRGKDSEEHKIERVRDAHGERLRRRDCWRCGRLAVGQSRSGAGDALEAASAGRATCPPWAWPISDVRPVLAIANAHFQQDRERDVCLRSSCR